MALKSPSVFHNYWGVFATPAALPNVLGSGTQTEALRDGDIAFVTSLSTMHQCTDATPEAASWKRDPRAIHSSSLGEIAQITAKSSPTSSDLVLIEDAAATYAKKKATIGTLPYGRQPSAIHDNISGEIAALTEKTTLVDADKMLIEDSEAADAKKMIQVVNLPPGDEMSNLWFPPASAHSEDDEFDGGTIDSSWLVRNVTDNVDGSLSSGAVDAYDTTFTSGNVVRANQNGSERRSWILFQAPSNTKTYYITKGITVPTNLLMIMRGRIFQRYTDPTSDGLLGFIIAPDLGGGVPSSSDFVTAQMHGPGGVQYCRFLAYTGGTPSAINTTTDVATEGQALEYMAIHKIATTYHGWVGTSGGNWIYMGSFTHSSTMARIGFTLYNAVSSAPGSSIVGVDFIRFLETSNFLF